MIKLRELSLPEAERKKMAEWQGDVNAKTNYAERVKAADDLWGNKRSSKAFEDISKALEEICHHISYCVYCELPAPITVDHIRPKVWFPELVFVWENYAHVCVACNSKKRDRFAVFSKGTGKFTELIRKRGEPIIEPEAGQMVFIDPRREDGMELMELNLETGMFLSLGGKKSKRYQRAEYTLKILGLNERQRERKQRVGAYQTYRVYLEHYIEKRDAGKPAEELERHVKDMREKGHPTVWAEMKRQRSVIKELNELFTQAPEALNW